jgi:hypothetical protein
MSKSFRTDSKRLRRQLKNYRSVADKNKDSLDKQPLLGQQLRFWMESARFCTTELEIWNEAGNPTKSDHALKKAQECFGHVDALITQLLDK